MTYTAPEYMTAAQTAKLLRKALKEAFPGTKFSVRSSTYAGGASVSVDWHNGPTTEQVDAVAQRFSGATFDGMTDSLNQHRSLLDGREVRFGANFVFCNRKLTADFITARLARVCARYGVDPDTVEVRGANSIGWWLDGRDLDAVQRVSRRVWRYSEAPTLRSPTAERVG